MPANNKAVVANSLTVSRPMQDSTRKMKDILESVGYQVDRANADVKLFRNLSRYGVIYIEAHGWPSPFVTPGSLLGDNSDTTCRSQGGTMILVTTTTVSDDNVSSYIPDMVCGRLRIVTVLVRQFGPPHYRARVIAVTANYIRKYDSGTFPVGAVMSLSSCRAFDASGQSEWHDLIVEKSKHAVFIGWSKKTHWGISARAFLNLFQLATGSNEQFAVIQKNKDGSLGKGYILLEKNAPPVVPQPIASVMMSLPAQKVRPGNQGSPEGLQAAVDW